MQSMHGLNERKRKVWTGLLWRWEMGEKTLGFGQVGKQRHMDEKKDSLVGKGETGHDSGQTVRDPEFWKGMK